MISTSTAIGLVGTGLVGYACYSAYKLFRGFLNVWNSKK